MPRVERVDISENIYHVLNRANARVQIFDTKEDYILFENILTEGIEKYDMRILAYCIMPNHWHLILNPKNDGDLSKFMDWVTNTHTRRWHTGKGTIGQGHLYQGRYKSFICQDDTHFLTLIRYVERNALKANLVKKAENWKWSSVWRRENGTEKEKKLLTELPLELSRDYLTILNQPQSEKEEEALEKSIRKSSPYGEIGWVEKTVKKFGLEQTLKGVGRPKNGG